ncbi:zinc finger protein 112-like [Poecilia reticulata]|uniref:zinc finger protein 112-like n=1 Tax=Poecilia reticulata TaxID=8081 RepID=UPI0007EA2BBA|nr:PREDICTED: zinc finger protein 112-like [Poecilia reticulata]
MSEMMKVEADEPGGFSLEPPIPATFTSDLEETQDNKDLMLPLHQMLVIKEVPHDWTPSLGQQDPDNPHIKEEEEELWISQEEEQLTVKIEDEEKPQSSVIYRNKTEDKMEAAALTTWSVEQMETESNGEECEGPEPDWNQVPVDSFRENKIKVKLGTRGKRAKFSKRTAQAGVHVREELFGCSVCGKGFKNKTSVKIHMMIHTGKRTQYCGFVGKGLLESAVFRHICDSTPERNHLHVTIVVKRFTQRTFLRLM